MVRNTERSSAYSFLAFYTLYSHFYEVRSLSFDDICKSLYPEGQVDAETEKPLFITWKKKSKSSYADEDGYSLRGCIGTFAELPIITGIKRYSLIAALEDSRFPSITESEVSSLKCSCNILEHFETIYKDKGDIYNWDIGTHGIELKFKHPRSKRIMSATFLPEVMEEQGWDKDETYRNLIEKAGCWEEVENIFANYKTFFVEVIRYIGNKSSITEKEFMEKLNKV